MDTCTHVFQRHQIYRVIRHNRFILSHYNLKVMRWVLSEESDMFYLSIQIIFFLFNTFNSILNIYITETYI